MSTRAGSGDARAALARIWAHHRDDVLGHVAALEDAVAALVENRLSGAARREAERYAHRLAGSAGTFGFAGASDSALRLESVLAGTGPLAPDEVRAAAEHVVALRLALDDVTTPSPGSGVAGEQGSRGPDVAAEPSPSRTGATDPTVLVVDDDPAVLDAIAVVLEGAGLRVVGTEDPAGFWAALEETRPDLVVLDVDMPDHRGDELCRVMRGDPRWAGLPILFLTAHSDPGTVAATFAAGADDFLAKPFSGPDLLERIRNRLERIRQIRESAEAVGTGGAAGPGREEPDLGTLLEQAVRTRRPFSIARVELDGVEEIVDAHGRSMGERVLRRSASLLRGALGHDDVSARWDGEGFLLGMHDTAREAGVQRVASMLEALHDKRFVPASGSRIRVTFSAGVATCPDDAETVAGLVEAAGRALQQARRDGGDRVLAGTGEAVDVLVVEDDDALAELLEHALTTRGLRSRHLTNGQDVVRRLTGHRPALRARVVLLDVDLPALNGLGALRQMAAAGTLDGTRVIMLTARSGEQEVIEALELGAFDHVAKPFSVPVLMQRVQRALGA